MIWLSRLARCVSVTRGLVSVKRDLVSVKRDLVSVKRDLVSVKRDLALVRRMFLMCHMRRRIHGAIADTGLSTQEIISYIENYYYLRIRMAPLPIPGA